MLYQYLYLFYNAIEHCVAHGFTVNIACNDMSKLKLICVDLEVIAIYPELFLFVILDWYSKME